MTMLMPERKYAGRRWCGGAAVLGMIAAVAAVPAFTGGGALHAQAAPAAAGAAQAAPVDTTITIRTTGSNLEFSPSRIAAKQGTRIRIRFVNESTLPHNVVLVKTEDDIDMLGTAAFQAGKTDYVPVEHKDRMIAFTELAVPGETVEMTFVVPRAGEYFFVCLYSGHYNMMVGTLRSLE